jgi:ketosteroid isomerase-like protein
MNRLISVFAAAVAFALLSPAVESLQGPAAPVAAPGAATTVSPEIHNFQKIEDAWSEAVNQRDQYALELVLSPLFVDVAATGEITTRNQQLVHLMTTDDKTLHLEQKVITVWLLGEIAVANGTYTLRHKGVAGVVDEKGVFTHVFERGRSGWLCINSQRTSVREDAAGKQKKPSSAEMPFHIPLFSKDK